MREAEAFPLFWDYREIGILHVFGKWHNLKMAFVIFVIASGSLSGKFFSVLLKRLSDPDAFQYFSSITDSRIFFDEAAIDGPFKHSFSSFLLRLNFSILRQDRFSIDVELFLYLVSEDFRFIYDRLSNFVPALRGGGRA